jgi:hypothetical protein
MSGSCTSGTVGRRLWPNNLDMTDSTSSQKNGVGYPMPGMAPPISDGRKVADYPKGIPQGNRPRRTRPGNQTTDQDDRLRRGHVVRTPPDKA